MSEAEEYKLIGETNFGLWLTREGDSKYLRVPTKKIEVELKKLIRLARKEAKKERLEDLTHAAKVFRNKGYKKKIKAQVHLETIKEVQKRIDWLEFESPVNFKTFILGKDKFDIELEKLKKLKRFLFLENKEVKK